MARARQIWVVGARPVDDGSYGARLADETAAIFELVSRAHERARDFQLEVLLLWRMEFYRHLNRLAEPLERSLDGRFPIQKAVL